MDASSKQAKQVAAPKTPPKPTIQTLSKKKDVRDLGAKQVTGSEFSNPEDVFKSSNSIKDYEVLKVESISKCFLMNQHDNSTILKACELNNDDCDMSSCKVLPSSFKVDDLKELCKSLK